MTKLPVIDNASPEPTRRACLKGVAGFALAALGGLNQAARAAAIPEQSAQTHRPRRAARLRRHVAGRLRLSPA